MLGNLSPPLMHDCPVCSCMAHNHVYGFIQAERAWGAIGEVLSYRFKIRHGGGLDNNVAELAYVSPSGIPRS